MPLTGILTVTRQEAIFPPSEVTACTVASPAPTAVTSPDCETVATPSLSEYHVTPASEAFSGRTVALSWWVSPGLSSTAALSREIPVTRLMTVTSQTALTLSDTLTVTFAVPALRAVTLPSASTEATAGASEVHVKSLCVELDGQTVATILALSPSRSFRLVLSSEMCCAGLLTVTVQLAENEPSLVVAVTAAVPGPTAVTVPSEETETTSGSELFQTTLTSEASSGETVGLMVKELPMDSRVYSTGAMPRPVTGVVTMTLQ